MFNILLEVLGEQTMETKEISVCQFFRKLSGLSSLGPEKQKEVKLYEEP